MFVQLSAIFFFLFENLLWKSSGLIRNRITMLTLFFYIIYQTNQYFHIPGEQILGDGMLNITPYSIGNEIFILILTILILMFRPGNPVEILIQSCQCGISCFLISQDLQIVVLSLQLINQSFYFLLTISKNSERVFSGSLKYLLLSAFATILFLQGSNLFYGKYGTMNMDLLSILNQYTESWNWGEILIQSSQMFKLGAAPFFQWVADIYALCSTEIVQFLATIPKVTILSLLNGNFILSPSSYLFIGNLSLLIGSIGLAVQKNLKRIIAFSTISHMGFLIISQIFLPEITIFYYFFYSLTTILLFGITFFDLSNRFAMGALILAFFSLAGIPPLIGFFTKQEILKSLMESGYYGTVQNIILTSGISAGYYIRVIKNVVFHSNTERTQSVNSFPIAVVVISLILSVLKGNYFILFI